MNENGFVIAIDGVDGCGKSGQVAKLAEVLTQRGYSVSMTYEPTTDSDFGRHIRKILEHEEPAPSAETFQYLFYCDRIPHWRNVLLPSKEAGQIIISDRERMVTYSYGVAGGASLETMVNWHRELPSADLFVYLRISPSEAIRRIHARCEEQGIEKEYFEREDRVHRNVKSFDTIAEANVIDNLIVVDGEGSFEEVTDRLLATITQRLEGE